MTKITADYLARSAFVYVRQSTADQLVHNQESLRRQYGLAGRAKQQAEARRLSQPAPIAKADRGAGVRADQASTRISTIPAAWP